MKRSIRIEGISKVTVRHLLIFSFIATLILPKLSIGQNQIVNGDFENGLSVMDQVEYN